MLLQEVAFAYIQNDSFFYKGNESNTSVWPGKVHQGLTCFLMLTTIFICSDGIPPDGTPVIVIEPLHISFTIITGILAALCITLSLSGCVFMFVFRERKLVSIYSQGTCMHSVIFLKHPYRVVKLTSPNLNYLIVAGTILLSLSMLQYSVATTNPIIVTLLCWVCIYTYM